MWKSTRHLTEPDVSVRTTYSIRKVTIVAPCIGLHTALLLCAQWQYNHIKTGWIMNMTDLVSSLFYKYDCINLKECWYSWNHFQHTQCLQEHPAESVGVKCLLNYAQGWAINVRNSRCDHRLPRWNSHRSSAMVNSEWSEQVTKNTFTCTELQQDSPPHTTHWHCPAISYWSLIIKRGFCLLTRLIS